jgi:hypothetical protein
MRKLPYQVMGDVIQTWDGAPWNSQMSTSTTAVLNLVHFALPFYFHNVPNQRPSPRTVTRNCLLKLVHRIVQREEENCIENVRCTKPGMFTLLLNRCVQNKEKCSLNLWNRMRSACLLI